MARKKLSEISAKKLLHTYLGLSYNGLEFDAENDDVSKIEGYFVSGKTYVVKIDEAVKKRFKQGLVALDLKSVDEIAASIENFKKKGFRYFIIEEFIIHEKKFEKYFSMQRTRTGTIVWYSEKGGVDIEKNEEDVKKILINGIDDIKSIAVELSLPHEFLEKLVEAFDIFYFSFIEINPLVVIGEKIFFLDIASEVDSAAEFFAQAWSSSDFRDSSKDKTVEEKNILKLSQKSQASFKLDLLNPDGSIFMLLSGGGASIVLADEVHNLGFGKELSNYGEYSGNPNEEETYIYTKNLLSLLLKSGSDKKVLIISGGVANFTDVRITFRGIIRALDEVSKDLRKQKVKVFVRRGGPHQKEGLKNMEEFLKKESLFGSVHDQSLVLTDIVKQAIDCLTQN